MKVFYIDDLNNSDMNIKDEVNVTIGFFDCVHLGHKSIINKLNDSGEKSLIITFDTHPNKQLIVPIEDKIKIFESYNIDYLIVIHMNEVNTKTSHVDFLSFLKNLHINCIYVGNDFRFGNKAVGTINDLKDKFNVSEVEFINNGNNKLSSTNVRKYILNGEVEKLKKILGHNYIINGEVEQGNSIGRTIGFPTANLYTKFLIPKTGVFATIVHYNNRLYKGLTNIGIRPTVNGKSTTIETYIVDFNEQIYGKTLELEFIKYIRSEKKFNSLDELKQQINKDKMSVKDVIII